MPCRWNVAGVAGARSLPLPEELLKLERANLNAKAQKSQAAGQGVRARARAASCRPQQVILGGRPQAGFLSFAPRFPVGHPVSSTAHLHAEPQSWSPLSMVRLHFSSSFSAPFRPVGDGHGVRCQMRVNGNGAQGWGTHVPFLRANVRLSGRCGLLSGRPEELGPAPTALSDYQGSAVCGAVCKSEQQHTRPGGRG